MNLTVNIQSPSGLLKRSYPKSSQNEEPPAKIAAQLEFYYKLEAENTEDTDNDTESVYSIQDKETDFVKDTTDSSYSDDSDDSDYTDDSNVEFEVASLSEVDVHVRSFWGGVDLESSGTDDVASAEVIKAIRTDNIDRILSSPVTEDEVEDDLDNSIESISRQPNITVCTQCQGHNDNPSFHYCKKCYQVRKAIFPPRPRRIRSRDNESSNSVSSQESKQIIEEKVHSFFKCSSQDSGLGSSSQESCAVSSLDLDKIRVPVETSKQIETPTLDDGDKCIMCTEQPKNGVFVHGRIGHMCCCYKCAVKTWARTKRCPVCSCKVKNVLKVFAS